MIKIEIATIVDKNLVKIRKKARLDLISNSLAKEFTSKARLIKTNRLLEQTRSRATNLENASNINKQLINYWQCHDKQCNNKNNYCFINYTNKHYSIEALKQARWTKVIVN